MGIGRSLSKKKERLDALNAAKTKYMLETGLSNIQSMKDSVKARNSRVSRASRLGMSREAAVVLELSGQLEFELERMEDLNKKGDLNKDGLRILSEAIMEQIPPEEQAAALKYIVEGPMKLDDVNDIQNELINAAFSAKGPEGVEKVFGKISSADLGAPTISSTTFSNRPMEVLTSEEANRIKSTISRNVAGLFGAQLVRLDSGDFSMTGPNAAQAQRISNEMYREFTKAYNDPSITGSSLDIIDGLTKSVEDQRFAGTELADIRVTVDPITINPPPTPDPTIDTSLPTGPEIMTGDDEEDEFEFSLR